MIILRYKSFSRIQDEEYRELIQKKRNSIKDPKEYILPLTTVGALAGAHTGYIWKHSVKSALTGTAIGAPTLGTIGYLNEKRRAKKLNKKLDEKLEIYEKASKKEKAHLLEKEKFDQKRFQKELQSSLPKGSPFKEKN